MLSQRVNAIGMSQTLRISALAQELRASGADVLDFSAGQPDFPTPDGVKEAGRRAIAEDKTRYTANAGLLELRQAIADSIEGRQGVRYEPSQVLVSSGAKASLYFAFMTLLDPGDEVLLPRPYWVSYPEQIRLAGATPIEVPCREEQGFRVSPEDIEALITPRSRALVLNYPSNPTGACYSGEELGRLGEVCLRHDLWIVADEIYSRLVFDGRRHVSIAALDPRVAARSVIIDGMSKSYSMTGWRLGYAAGPADVIAGMGRLQSHSTSNASSIAQWAGVEALRSPEAEEEIGRRVGEFQKRRDEIVVRLREIGGVTCNVPDGSFYAFPNLAGLLGRSTGDGTTLDNTVVAAEYLLEAARVAVVPGDAFGAPENFRVSYAVSLERIEEGVARIAEAFRALT